MPTYYSEDLSEVELLSVLVSYLKTLRDPDSHTGRREISQSMDLVGRSQNCGGGKGGIRR